MRDIYILNVKRIVTSVARRLTNHRMLYIKAQLLFSCVYLRISSCCRFLLHETKILRSFDRRLFFVVAVRRTLSVALILMVNYMRAYMRQCGI